MEVEGDVLFKIGRMKAGVCTAGKSSRTGGRPGELPVPAALAAPGSNVSSWVSDTTLKTIALSFGRQVPKRELFGAVKRDFPVSSTSPRAFESIN